MPTNRPDAVSVPPTGGDARTQRCLDVEESGGASATASFVSRSLTPPPQDDETEQSAMACPADDVSLDKLARDIPTPVSTTEDTSSESDARLSQSIKSVSPVLRPIQSLEGQSNFIGTLDSPWPRTRFEPNSTSSYLRPGSKFRGKQASDRQVYEVEVQLQHVDMQESFMCGYLKIQGLTDDHPTLTTFFEGEIIGSKYTFQTKHPEWGSTDKVDMSHWGRFEAWKQLSKQAKQRSPEFSSKSFCQREYMWMRWKEYFLVPDHRVRTISGASFEGFYYICFNQVTGRIDGIYFHAKSEKYQKLELHHVEDHGCMAAFEFR